VAVLVDAALAGRATVAGAGIICPWSSRIEDPDWYAFGMGPYAGAIAARLALGLPAGLDLSPFDPLR
jgi:D-amino-acid dehydrogenase